MFIKSKSGIAPLDWEGAVNSTASTQVLLGKVNHDYLAYKEETKIIVEWKLL